MTVGRAHEHDEMSLLWLCYIVWQKEDCPGGWGLIQSGEPLKGREFSVAADRRGNQRHVQRAGKEVHVGAVSCPGGPLARTEG